jgi:hypothetical protein
VLSPNGDGIDERQSLAFKLVRPSTVTASLVGPDRIPRLTQTGERLPGIYRLTWNGRNASGGLERQGRYRWVINAVDNLSQHSVAERAFWLNATLGHLRVSHRTLRVRRRGTAFRVGFRLYSPARVWVRIETATGVRVRTVTNRFMRPGFRRVTWNGRYGNGVLARRGGYVVRVVASNSYGPTELTRRFSVRRAR